VTTFGQRLLLAVRPLGDRASDEVGRCSACGRHGRFAFNSWLVPPQARAEWGDWAPDFARRETLICPHCFATLRTRRLADVLLEHYAVDASSLAELVEEPLFRDLDVAEVNAAGALHRYLARLPRLRYSEYGGGAGRHEDLANLTYSDASIDLVLTSDSLEHVRDWRGALAETRRVLRPGGRHVFTVPLIPTRTTTEDVSERGWYHSRGRGAYRLVRRRSDMLVHTAFGLDVADILRGEGFEPEFHFEGEAACVICALAL
jgi:SAM-dependent methyltransferase